MPLIVSVILVALVAVAFAWLLTRAWGIGNGLIKWPGVILSGLLTLLTALIAVVAFMGFLKLTLPASNPVPPVQVAGTAEQRARGERLSNYCAACHSTTHGFPLDGGAENFVGGEGGGPSFGVMYAPNLTPGGPLREWSDGEIVRAIREGVSRDGRPLVIMPSNTLHNLSDSDVQSIVAFLRAQPAVDRVTPPTELNLLGALLIGSNTFPTSVQPPITQPVSAPPIGATPEYGRYATTIMGCGDCHGPSLTGGEPGGFGPPAGPNLVAGAQRWTDAEFVRTMRTGMTAEGRPLDPEVMPWPSFSAALTDDELRAMYLYLRSL